MKNLLNGLKSPLNRRSFIKKQSAARKATRGASLFVALVAAVVFQPSPAIAQSYCGPVIKVSFNGINGNGQYSRALSCEP